MTIADSTKTSLSKTINVDLGERSYPIHIGSGQIFHANISQYVLGKKALIVTNETIAPLYLDTLMGQLPNKHVDQVILKDGEQFKTLDNLNLTGLALGVNSINLCLEEFAG